MCKYLGIVTGIKDILISENHKINIPFCIF